MGSSWLHPFHAKVKISLWVVIFVLFIIEIVAEIVKITGNSFDASSSGKGSAVWPSLHDHFSHGVAWCGMVWHGVHLVCTLPKLLALAPSWAHSPRGLHDHVPMQLLCLSLSLCRSLLPPDLFSIFGLEYRIHQNTTCVSEVLKLSTWVV